MRSTASEVHFRSARDALAAGIGMVHQELSDRPRPHRRRERLPRQPADHGAGIVDWRAHGRARRASISPASASTSIRAPRMGALPIGLQQLIELARVLFSGARIIILDEPTSALSPPEVERLFAVLRRLKASGRSFIFISHFLDDMLAISDTVTIFRNGRKHRHRSRRPDRQGLGDRAHDRQRPRGARGELYRRDRARQRAATRRSCWRSSGLGAGRAFRDVSLDVRAGEVLGVYGFMGCGQLELARTLFGKLQADARHAGASTARSLRLAQHRGGAPRRHRLRAGEPALDAVPPRAGLQEHLDQHPRAHRALLLKPAAERRHRPRAMSRRCDPAADGRARCCGNLSGGNQQKVALAKWLT